jgi:hypothetical protein
MLVLPILSILMLLQALFGSETRALSMAIAIDECGNSGFGGPPQQTISRRTGLALIAGKAWAVPASKFIDFLFGKGHCLVKHVTDCHRGTGRAPYVPQ